MLRINYIKHLLLIAILLFATSFEASAQKKKQVEEVDTVQVPFFNGVSVHVNLVSAGQTFMSDRGAYDIGIRINLKDRYFPALEGGVGHADMSEDYNAESWFKTTSPFARIGCDFNILKNKHDIYKLFAGFRYGISRTKYDMTLGAATSEDDATVVYTEYDDLTMTSHWLEGVFGTDAKIWGPLHLGWDVRYKRMLNGSKDNEYNPWYIPGLGKYKRAGFSFNFNLIIAIF